jgi:hypothetical protein
MPTSIVTQMIDALLDMMAVRKASTRMCTWAMTDFRS